MSSVNWNDKSLSDLKQIVAGINGAMFDRLRTSAEHFKKTAAVMQQTSESLSKQSSALSQAWQGKAALAASDDAQHNQMTMNDTRSSSETSSSSTDSYARRLQRNHEQASQIKNVDTSFGHAVKSGGWGGLVGIGAAMVKDREQYNQNHRQMVKIVSQMDSDGQDHADAMNSTYWPYSTSTVAPPQRVLPPVPGSGGSASSGGSYTGYVPSGGARPSGSYTTSMAGPALNGDDNEIISGTGSNHSPAIPTAPTHPQSGPSPTVPGAPTVTQGGPGTISTPVAGGPGGPVGPAPTTGGISGAGAVGGVLGGAGLLGAGALGGNELVTGGTTRGGTPLGEDEGGLRNRGGVPGEGEREPALGGGRGAGPADGAGEPRLGARSGSGAFGDEEPGLRGTARTAGGVPGDELGAPREGVLGEGRPAGFGGEPVAGEAGRMGYPMGGGARSGGSDDEDAPMPDYLVETDGVWGDGASAAPPVIGD